ncbi:MAG: alpha/beta fold hydrolase [Actinobacteria bacterium]|nr:alpha/beta fold hydrolase [Actinomycetota bacterium]
MARVTVNGVELFYETTGLGDRVVLTHGSWGDATNWDAVVGPLAERFEVVIWDRRGHSRSQDGDGPGSWREDAADLAVLIEHLGDPPVHVFGNSAGGCIVLTLVTERPDLVASAAVHEPPLFGLLAETEDERIAEALAASGRETESVVELIEAGDHRAAARHFIEDVALGPGAWDQLPERVTTILETNAPTFLDESPEPFEMTSIDRAALAATTVPLMISYGTESPELLPAAAKELARLVPVARLEVIAGAGHVPHMTHPEAWVTTLMDFYTGVPPVEATR